MTPEVTDGQPRKAYGVTPALMTAAQWAEIVGALRTRDTKRTRYLADTIERQVFSNDR